LNASGNLVSVERFKWGGWKQTSISSLSITWPQNRMAPRVKPKCVPQASDRCIGLGAGAFYFSVFFERKRA
jgi:hypothetical protein